jgi:hypothetical protein
MARRTRAVLLATLLRSHFMVGLQLPPGPLIKVKTFLERAQLQETVAAELGAETPVIFAAGTDAKQQEILWRWVASATSATTMQPSVLAFPGLRGGKESQDLEALLSKAAPLVDALGNELIISRLTSDQYSMEALVMRSVSVNHSANIVPSKEATDEDHVVRARLRHWVDRVLVRYRMCPFTESSKISGVGLEEFGVAPAEIRYVETNAATLPDLLANFWQAVDSMLTEGDKEVSSIVMACPSWDNRWSAWYEDVFPLLEESVIVAKLSRTLGIVCFHPNYVTPSETFLRKHRFGHMHPPRKLAAWVESSDSALASKLSLPQLNWAGSYQRRSPHAMINVLWSHQLELAENKRTSENLYVRNIRRLLKEGIPKLEREAARERRKDK